MNGEAGAVYDPSDLTAEKVAWRRNLLTWSEDFTNAAWPKTNATVTANAAIAPDGTITADKIIPTVTNAGYVQQLIAVTAGLIYTHSVYVKAAGLTSVRVDLGNTFGSVGMTVNLITGGISGAGSYSPFAIDVGNGWWRVGYTKASGGTGIGGYAIIPQGTANGTDGVLAWGAQVELTSTASSYQCITDFTSDFLATFPTHGLFQDSAGTTPVTALGQPVGLVLDTKTGGAGSELIVNGNFNSGTTGWSATRATLSAANNQLTITSTSNYGVGASTGFATVIGRTYRASATLVSCSSAVARIRKTDSATDFNANSAHLINDTTWTNGQRFTVFFQATATTTYIMGVTDTHPSNIVISNVSVCEVSSAYAIQPTSASRPLLDARVNLLTYSEQFDNANWIKFSGSTITTNSTIAPDGTTTADTLNAPATTGTYRTVRRSPAGLLVSTAHQLSVFAKASTANWIALRFWDVGSGAAAWFNVNTGVVGTVQAGVTASISAVGNGWFRCVLNRTTGSTISFNEIDIQLADADNSDTATAGTSVFLWGADLRTATDAAYPYQRIAAATDYADVGAPRSFAFDGVDDSLYTASNMDLSGTDKVTVLTGVRKLSDAALGIVAELTNNDFRSFSLQAPPSASARYRFSSTGATTIVSATSAASYAAPITNVVTGQGDINAPSVALRVNAVADGASTSSQGGGNYASSLLYIGRRGNSGSPFNGKLYQLIVRGAATDAGTLVQAERYVAQRTGITL